MPITTKISQLTGSLNTAFTIIDGNFSGLETELTKKQSTGYYAITNHEHSIIQISGLQAALNTKQASGNYASANHTHNGYAALSHSHANYAASTHVHQISEVSGLQAALSGARQSRQTFTVNIPSLATGAFINLDVNIGCKSFALYSISTENFNTWTVVYGGNSFRQTDINLGRSVDRDPIPAAGVIAEAITFGSSPNKTVTSFYPAPIGYLNTTILPIRVHNIHPSNPNFTNSTLEIILLPLEY
jgi:hypothetical protein